jgi:hypothetical protein
MPNNISRGWVAGSWLAGCAVIAAVGIVAGAPLTLGMLELVLMACLVLPAVMLLIWHGPPAQTVAELLHATDDVAAPKVGRS